MFSMSEQIRYYRQRAAEYERIYHIAERQEDLARLRAFLEVVFAGQHIIEIACGTGYWTEVIAKSAAYILATDVNAEMLDIARQKKYLKANVTFLQVDFNQLDDPPIPFEGLFGGFILSHIPLQELDAFLETALRQVQSGSTLVFADNRYVENSSRPHIRRDEFGNSYQRRVLQSGEVFEVIKNFPDAAMLRSLVEGNCTDFQWIELKYYWLMKCRKN